MRCALSLTLLASVSLLACAPATGAGPNASVTSGGARSAPNAAPGEPLAWADLDSATLERARREKKYVLLDGAAEWCHWCHVMEATTYHDPAVRKILDAHFIAVKVDVDSRPDVLERYGDWGWPATILFAPDATEIGKYRGYIPPEKLVAILEEVVKSGAAEAGTRGGVGGEKPSKAPRRALEEEHLAWIQRAVDVELDDYWDEKQGGWGRGQKAPIGTNNAWMLWKAERGDAEAKRKVVFTLEKQAKLLDPVWGGIYQYSAAGHWDEPHFEKLMTFQAPAIENYAVAYRLTKDPKQLERAKQMVGYVDRFMKSQETGGFFTTQDADVNAHDRTKKFVDGHDYYPLGEKERLARGVPRIDTHEYAKENGLAIAAYVTMFEVTQDRAALASAEKAARRILASHKHERWAGVTHDVAEAARSQKQLFLADNAAFGFALLRLYEATKNEEWAKAAKAIADFMLAELHDEDGGGFFAATKDPDAFGVFSGRRVPFEDNVMALRMLARLARTSTDPKYKVAIDQTLRAIGTPEQIKTRGRWLGDVLIALEETKGIRGLLR